MKYTYLLIDFFTLLVPFVFSFHPKLAFYKNWKALFPAMLITGTLYLLWDNYFTVLGVWGFNPNYLIDVYIGKLPIEEIAFFLCIPYSCIFTFHCLQIILKPVLPLNAVKVINVLLITGSVILAICFRTQYYTLFTFLVLPVLIAISAYILKASWLPTFYVVYAILLIPFLIVNGLLTGSCLAAPVVWYNNNRIIGIRLLTIPFEDIFYGMGLILLNMIIYMNLLKKQPA